MTRRKKCQRTASMAAVEGLGVRCRTEQAHALGDVVLPVAHDVCVTAQKAFRSQCTLRSENARTPGEVPLARIMLPGCKSSNRESVRDVTEWLRGTLASTGMRVCEDESAAAILFVGSTTELRFGAENSIVHAESDTAPRDRGKPLRQQAGARQNPAVWALAGSLKLESTVRTNVASPPPAAVRPADSALVRWRGQPR